MEKVKIKTATIKLDQFLKWANLVSTGGEAKLVIKAGEVMVNGEVQKKRGATLISGDKVKYNDITYEVTTS